MKITKDFYFEFDKPVKKIRLEIVVDDSQPNGRTGNEQFANYGLNMNVKAYPVEEKP